MSRAGHVGVGVMVGLALGLATIWGYAIAELIEQARR